ncbi:MAG: ATPase [Chloroflexi bacterium]|nr:MAG: ATPase [Chloroflexota bacterium]TME48721.1 MAG: ATPase [Chloroflexota bacterium]
MTVTTSRKAVVTLPTDTQILITREFDSPKHLVYRAYTEPALVKRWWSEDRGEVTSVDADPRLGGKWRNVMRANDGSEVAFHGEYREIVPNERLVVTDVYEGIPDPESAAALVTITFTEREGRTILTSLMDLPSKDIRDAIISSGMEGGLQESYDHLEEVVRSLR